MAPKWQMATDRWGEDQRTARHMTIDILETYTDWCLGRALVLCVRAPTGHAATSDISGDTFCHEYHLVWLPPAPAAPPRLILCSSKGTLVKVSSCAHTHAAPDQQCT